MCHLSSWCICNVHFTKHLLGKDSSSAAAVQGILTSNYNGAVTAMVNGINIFQHSVSADLEPLLPPTGAPVMEVPTDYVITH